MMVSRPHNSNSSSHFHSFDKHPYHLLQKDSTFEHRLAYNPRRQISATNQSSDPQRTPQPSKPTSLSYSQSTKQVKTDFERPLSQIDNDSAKFSSAKQSPLDPNSDSNPKQRANQSSNEHMSTYTAMNRRSQQPSSATLRPSGSLTPTSSVTGGSNKLNRQSEQPLLSHGASSASKILMTMSQKRDYRDEGVRISNSYELASKTLNSNPSSTNSSLVSENSITKTNKPVNEFYLGARSQSGSYRTFSKESPVNVTDDSGYKSKNYDMANLRQILNYEPTKCSVKSHGIISGYAANTNQGLVRNYNEDRVSIILNISKPSSRDHETWPKCSFFGVFDGHGGAKCADFLRDNLHQFVIKDSNFPWNPKEAIAKGFETAEKTFLELAQNAPSEVDRSGSCAVVALIVGDMCYIANVGDSRAVMSGGCGSKVYTLSRDHKPLDDIEQKRIVEHGGKIYQSQTPVTKNSEDGKSQQMQVVLGPHRVFPGRLSVCRTFGDIEAKLPKYGGNPGVVIATPDIKAFKIGDEHDFVVLACDGIFDKLSSKETIRAAWNNLDKKNPNDVHQRVGLAVDNILLETVNQKSMDNITVVLVAFKNFEPKTSATTQQNENTGERKNSTNSPARYTELHRRQDKGKSQRESSSYLYGMSEYSSPKTSVTDDAYNVSQYSKQKSESATATPLNNRKSYQTSLTAGTSPHSNADQIKKPKVSSSSDLYMNFGYQRKQQLLE